MIFKSHSYKIFLSVSLLTAFLVACFVSSAWAQKKPSKPIGVIIAKASVVDFTDEVEALGTLKANESVNLTSTLTERVTLISFTDNQRVQKGDVLVEMDASEERAELVEQQAILKEAESRQKRVEALIKKRVSSEATRDEVRRDLDSAKARINAIQTRIAERQITAPFDGVLGLRNISNGSTLQTGTLITTIDDDTIMKLDFSVPEIYLSSIIVGDRITAKSEAYPKRDFTGSIQAIDSRIDPVTRSINVRALLDNKDGLLKPGLLMQVIIQKNNRKALTVPEEAIIVDGDKKSVFITSTNDANQMIAVSQPVEIGTRKRGTVEIISGLNDGQPVIIHGGMKVRDGMEITILAEARDNETLDELLKQATQKEEQE